METGSEHDLKLGRALRDKAKLLFNRGNQVGDWHALASQAVGIHARVFAANLESYACSREYAASIAMRARLQQRHELAGGQLAWDSSDTLESYHFALQALREKGQKPDQYEINFIAGGALQEAIDPNGSRLSAALLAGRSAWLAVCSESPRLAREINPDLTSAERLKAKARALGRSAIAIGGIILGPKAQHITRFATLAHKAM